MKKYILVFSLFFALFGCKDYLDVVPDNVATIDNAFTDRYNTEKYLYTCYSYIPQHAGEDRNPALNAADNIWYNYNINKWGRNVAEGSQNADSPYFNYWDGIGNQTQLPSCFTGMRDCNILLENIDNVPDIPDWEKKRWKAEAKVIKAYLNFWLIQLYGPIPIIRENLPVSASPEEVAVHREPVDLCFDYVVELLDEASIDLPVMITNEASELGRFTQAIAKSLKAKVLLTAASPLYNGNKAFQSLIDDRGIQLFPSYDESKWQTAADACLEAIEVCHAQGIRLYQKDDYLTKYDLSDTTLYISALREVVSEKWNDELIWGNADSRMTSGMQSKATPTFFPTTGNPVQQNFAPTLRMAELFYTDKGLPIEEDPSWNFAERFTLKTIPSSKSLFMEPGEETVGLHFDREYRFYSSLAFDRGAWFGNGSYGSNEGTNDHYYIQGRMGEVCAPKEKANYSITGYWPKKMVHMDNNMTTAGGYSVTVYPFPVIRLGDLYLCYAEALNEAGQLEESKVWIDLIRNRAGLKGVDESWAVSSRPDKPSSLQGMREIVQQERLIELAFEGKRFWDIRRWKTASSLMNDKPIRGWSVTDEGGAESYYQVKVLQIQSYVEKDYFWPIKNYELSVNTSLIQNLGW